MDIKYLTNTIKYSIILMLTSISDTKTPQKPRLIKPMKSILFLLFLATIYSVVASTGMIWDTTEAGGKSFFLPVAYLIISIAASACVWHMMMKVNRQKREHKISAMKSNKLPVLAILILFPLAIHSFIKVLTDFEKGGVPLICSVAYYLLVVFAVIGVVGLWMKSDKKQETIEASGE
mgnify:FL=1